MRSAGRNLRMAVTALMVLHAVPALAAANKVKPAAIFTDHMVLQRDMKISIWGTAGTGQRITVAINGQTAEATTGKDGRWSAELPAMAAGGPHELKINSLTFKDVMIGDVWLCGGQSNMNWAVRAAGDADAEIAKADHPRIRLFWVKSHGLAEPIHELGRGRTTGWKTCTSKTVGAFSAVGFYFARELRKTMDVPLGMIHCNQNGSPAELWISAGALSSDDRFKHYLVRYQRLAAQNAEFATGRKANPGKGRSPKRPKRELGMPTDRYNAMIHPILRFKIRGVLWYQGESNAGYPFWYKGDPSVTELDRPAEYAALFPALIRDWRKGWGYDFPFLFVQLANYGGRQKSPTDHPWARLRESQLKTLALPKTGMAVAIDIGDAGNIHPPNKQDVGRRLALAARGVAYGEKGLVHSGPIYESHKVEGGKIRVKFTRAGSGLIAGPPEGAITVNPPKNTNAGTTELLGFAVAGQDKVFHWADAVIEANDVLVSCAKVPRPVAVRYGWAANPECNLYNRNGLPASPFRTDDWPPR